jgi:transmembrane sensor
MDLEPQRNATSRPVSLAALARNWVARRDEGLDEEARGQLRAWLAADASHATAFAAADLEGTELDWPLHSGTVDEVLAGLEARGRKRRKLRIAAGSVVALLVVAFVTVAQFYQIGTPLDPASSLVVLAPHTRTLPDGTVVELKDDAEIAVDFSGIPRAVRLIRGTAHFQVTRNPARPFIVTAAGVTARAVGTAFVVELSSHTVSVLVTAGTVAVDNIPAARIPISTPSAPDSPGVMLVEVGKSVNVSLQTIAPPPAITSLQRVELEEKLSWRIPRVEFSGTPLKDVIAILNRHNRHQFVIADASLGSLALSGLLRADKTDALVKMLESEFSVTAEQREQQILLRRPR